MSKDAPSTVLLRTLDGCERMLEIDHPPALRICTVLRASPLSRRVYRLHDHDEDGHAVYVEEIDP